MKSNRIIVVLMIILLGVPVVSLLISLILGLDANPYTVTDIAVDWTGRGVQREYIIHGEAYFTAMGYYGFTKITDRGWVPGKRGHHIYNIRNLTNDELYNERMYTLQGDTEPVAYYIEGHANVVYPEDWIFPSPSEFEPNRIALGLYHYGNPGRSRETYVLDNPVMMEALGGILQGEVAPLHTYTDDELDMLEAFCYDELNLYIFTDQVPGSAYEITSDRLQWSAFTDASDAERAENHGLAYIVLQVMNHGRRVLR